MTVWKETRLDYDSSDNLIYRGVNAFSGADESDDNWRICKYSYVNGNLTKIKGALIGPWTGRASLGWE